MDADPTGATHDYSRGSAALRVLRRRAKPASRAALAARGLLALAAVAGAFLLVLSTFTPVVEIRVLTTSDLAGQDTRISGGELHGVALLLIAVLALVALAGALRGARPAMIALAAAGALALGLVLVLDVPRLDDTGQIALLYENVSAATSTGFYYETVGAALVLLAGVGLLVLRGPRRLPGSSS
jgi:hypothetical protein